MIDESQLIFIISQPRAGSTLLQKIISNSDSVDTASEPWLLLPLLSIYKPELINAKFNYPIALKGFFDFLKKRNKEAEFKAGLRQLILSLYSPSPEYQYFLDKTPRNYEILEVMIDLFPSAKFIILKRHPLASLYSMISTWSGGSLDVRLLETFKRDFIVAPVLIHEFCEKYALSESVIEIKYESLVNEPEKSVVNLFRFLNLPYSEEVLKIGGNQKVKGIYGDDVYKEKPLSRIEDLGGNYMDDVNSDSQLGDFFHEYQEFLTEPFLQKYGYKKVDIKGRLPFWRKTIFKRLIGKQNEATN